MLHIRNMVLMMVVPLVTALACWAIWLLIV